MCNFQFCNSLLQDICLEFKGNIYLKVKPNQISAEKSIRDDDDDDDDGFDLDVSCPRCCRCSCWQGRSSLGQYPCWMLMLPLLGIVSPSPGCQKSLCFQRTVCCESALRCCSVPLWWLSQLLGQLQGQGSCVALGPGFWQISWLH